MLKVLVFNSRFAARPDLLEMDSGGFDDLLHQAQQLTADMDTGDAMPRVERSLFQIRDAAVKMAYKAPYTGRDSSDVKA